jgi:hypothetical protein
MPCGRCGYNLRGLPADGVCPECSAPVVSIFSRRILTLAPREALEGLRKGINLIFWGVVAYVCVSILIGMASFGVGIAGAAAAGAGAAGGGPGGMPPVFALLNAWLPAINVLPTIVIALGAWFLAAPDLRLSHSDQSKTYRTLLRVACICLGTFVTIGVITNGIVSQRMNAAMAGMAPGAGGAGANAQSPWAMLSVFAQMPWEYVAISAAAGVLTFAAWVLLFVGALQYVRWLAVRVPNDPLASRAKAFLWVLPLVYVLGSCVCGLGPLVAAALFCWVLWELRQSLPTVEERGVPTTA